MPKTFLPLPAPVPSDQLHLWPGRAVFVGVGYDSSRHRHLAVQMGVALEGKL